MRDLFSIALNNNICQYQFFLAENSDTEKSKPDNYKKPQVYTVNIKKSDKVTIGSSLSIAQILVQIYRTSL